MDNEVEPNNTDEYGSVACSSNIESNQPYQIILSTALILVKGAENRWHRCKALLDNGAQSNFITEKFCK